MAPLIVVSEIEINAPPAVIWDALTNPEQTKKYMFGCETVSDWKKGSPLLWKMNHEGKKLIAVKGWISEIEAPNRLVYTTIDPNSSIEDKPENYVPVTYELLPRGSATLLRVSQGDFRQVEDGERRYRDSYNNGEGWQPILVQIKKIVEE